MESSIHLNQNYHQEICRSMTRTLRDNTKIAPHTVLTKKYRISRFFLISLINKKNSHFRRLQLAPSKFHPTMHPHQKGTRANHQLQARNFPCPMINPDRPYSHRKTLISKPPALAPTKHLRQNSTADAPVPKSKPEPITRQVRTYIFHAILSPNRKD